MLKSTDTCSICQKPASTAIPIQATFFGRSLKVMAAVCQSCERREDRDEILAAYSQRIFGDFKLQ